MCQIFLGEAVEGRRGEVIDIQRKRKRVEHKSKGKGRSLTKTERRYR